MKIIRAILGVLMVGVLLGVLLAWPAMVLLGITVLWLILAIRFAVSSTSSSE